jgi:hypothetical protein
MTPPVQPGVEAVMRMPNMVATLLRDDTCHVSLLLLGISVFFFLLLYVVYVLNGGTFEEGRLYCVSRCAWVKRSRDGYGGM